MPNGSSAASRPTTTSRSTSHYYSVPSAAASARWSRRASPTPRSRFSTAASASPATPALGRANRSTRRLREHMPSAPPALCRMDAGAPHAGRPRRSVRHTAALFEAIMLRERLIPSKGSAACLGILRLAKEYGVDRLEAACRRGNDIGATSYGSIASILQHGLDRAYAQEKVPDGAPIQHANIRGQWLLPLTKGDDNADPSHPRTADRARAHRHGQGAGGTTTTERPRRAGLRRAARL